jgi:hypothetical protein
VNKKVGAILRQIVEDPELRRKLADNPTEALAELGVDLTPDELAEVRGGGMFAPPYVPVGPVVGGDNKK